METATILSHVDHTLLKPEATWDQIKTLCDEAMEFGCATVCIPPSYVKRAAEYVQGNLKICTVIGFPNGYNTMAAKIFETKDAVENGASEIDMVINLGWVKDRNWKDLAQEIAGVKAACLGRPLKVIIETCLLSDMEKIKLCQLVAKEGADYLKTSTGFSTGGATREDVALLRENLPKQVKLKASGPWPTGKPIWRWERTVWAPVPWWERPGSRDEGRRCPAAAGCAWARQGAGAAAGAVSPAHSPAPQPPAGAQCLPDPGAGEKPAH